jgi:GNAT superfamily N-acetyltransferase
MPVKIVRVQDRRALRDFIELPWFIYRRYSPRSGWVPPLRHSVTFILDAQQHPFWRHAQRELFLAYKHGGLAGRIAAIIDHSYNDLRGERMGAFGFFESVDDGDVADALFAAAAEWLKSRVAGFVRGPLSPSMNYEAGFLTEGFDIPPAIMMPYNQPYYPALAERAGFTKAKDLLAFHKDASTGIPPRLLALAERMQRKSHILIRPINFKDLANDMLIVRDLYNASWSSNWGFAPMSAEEMHLMGRELKPIARPELALLAFARGVPAGVMIGVPDYNQVLMHLNGNLGIPQRVRALFLRTKISSCRAVLFGFKPQFRRTGLPVLLYREAEQAARRLGYRSYELSWNLEDNELINRFDVAIGARIYKRYRIYEMPL